MKNKEKKLNAEKAKSPIKAQMPDPKNIACKDCIFRDMTTIEIDDVTIPVGVTKAYCDMYQEPPASNGKPHEVLFEFSKCEFYAKE